MITVKPQYSNFADFRGLLRTLADSHCKKKDAEQALLPTQRRTFYSILQSQSMRHSKIPNVFDGFIVSADNVSGRDVSNRNTGRNGRRRKHKFLHFEPTFLFGTLTELNHLKRTFRIRVSISWYPDQATSISPSSCVLPSLFLLWLLKHPPPLGEDLICLCAIILPLPRLRCQVGPQKYFPLWIARVNASSNSAYSCKRECLPPLG